jgi:hypothetical protein
VSSVAVLRCCTARNHAGSASATRRRYLAGCGDLNPLRPGQQANITDRTVWRCDQGGSCRDNRGTDTRSRNSRPCRLGISPTWRCLEWPERPVDRRSPRRPWFRSIGHAAGTPPRRGPRRQGSDAADLTTHPKNSENHCPPTRRNHVRGTGDHKSTHTEIPLTAFPWHEVRMDQPPRSQEPA